MTNDKFEAMRIIGSIIFFFVFIVLLPSKKKVNNQKKNTTTLQKIKRLKAEQKVNPPATTFGDRTGWREGGKPKVPFFSNQKNDFYTDEFVDYEVSFDVGGRRKNPPPGFDR